MHPSDPLTETLWNRNDSVDGKATGKHLKDRVTGVIRGAEEYREGGCSAALPDNRIHHNELALSSY